MSQSTAARLDANLSALRRVARNSAGDALEMTLASNAELTGLLDELERSVRGQFDDLSGALAAMQREVSALRPNAMVQRLPKACAELEALVGEGETAADAILAEAEAAMAEINEDAQSSRLAVKERLLRIIVACSFQDIAGQRVAKVTAQLREMEARLARFAAVLDVADAEPDAEPRSWLEGPELHGPANDQAVIDAIFSDDGEYADIDGFISPFAAEESGR